MISLISACVAFWPMLYVNDDSTGGGAAVFFMFLTIPAGVAVFLVSLLWVIWSHNNSLVEYNKWKSEEE
jgi:heme/copper-type cytochrome/quinol oxidase subunit 4